MNDYIKFRLKGFVKITDKDTGEVLLNKTNAVHFGNISTEIAKALTGDRSAFITYMMFGNGGMATNNIGLHAYREPRSSLNKNASETLYNTTFALEMTNNANDGILDPDVDVEVGLVAGNYEDIVINATIDNTAIVLQNNFSDSTGSNDQSPEDKTTDYVFNELGLYCGISGLGNLQTQALVEAFISLPDTTMITHIIFHPIEKSLNRRLDISYTLRILMADCESEFIAPLKIN